MSKGLKCRLEAYRVGDDWRDNFKHINYQNIEAALKAILTATERVIVYDRFGNRSSHGSKVMPISLDEKIFRIAVLMETQVMAETAELSKEKAE